MKPAMIDATAWGVIIFVSVVCYCLFAKDPFSFEKAPDKVSITTGAIKIACVKDTKTVSFTCIDEIYPLDRSKSVVSQPYLISEDDPMFTYLVQKFQP